MNLDTIGRMREALKMYQRMVTSESVLQSINEENDLSMLLENLKNDICITKNEIGQYVPLLTPAEMLESGIVAEMNEKELAWFNEYAGSYMIGNGYSEEQLQQLREDYVEYLRSDADTGRDISKSLIKLGWIPGIEPNTESFVMARENLYQYMHENTVRLIDLSESVKELPGVLTMPEYAGKALYPIYLVCTFTYTTFGKLITKVTNSVYSHAAIGFTPDLEHLYSYNMGNGNRLGGLSFESISAYLKDSAAAKVCVQVVFVTKMQYHKIKGNLEWYVSHWNDSKYSIGNLFNIAFGRATNSAHNISMICSQFVDSVLKIIKLDITGKPSNLVTPADIAKVKNPTVYKVYEGEAKDYDGKKVATMVNRLSKNAEVARSTVYEAALQRYTDKNVLEMYRLIGEMLTPKSVFIEVNIPFQIEDNGDISVDVYKSYETAYNEVHTLLKTLQDTESIKTELCKLWYLNCRLEKKIQHGKMRKKDKDALDKYYKLRSRVLNDFNKYMKKVYKEEKDFNFSEYYRNSDYYDGSVKVKRSTLKGIGSYIKNISGHI